MSGGLNIYPPVANFIVYKMQNISCLAVDNVLAILKRSSYLLDHSVDKI